MQRYIRADGEVFESDKGGLRYYVKVNERFSYFYDYASSLDFTRKLDERGVDYVVGSVSHTV